MAPITEHENCGRTYLMYMSSVHILRIGCLVGGHMQVYFMLLLNKSVNIMWMETMTSAEVNFPIFMIIVYKSSLPAGVH